MKWIDAWKQAAEGQYLISSTGKRILKTGWATIDIEVLFKKDIHAEWDVLPPYQSIFMAEEER